MNLNELVCIPDDSVDVPLEPGRDAIALALVMAEHGDEASGEVADELLSLYDLSGPSLSLVCQLAFLVSHEREAADEFLFDLALERSRK